MKSKFSTIWRLTLALVLLLGFSLVSSSDVSAVATSAKVKLAVGTHGTATWSTAKTPPTGYGAYSAILDGETQDETGYAAVVIPMGGTVTLSSITSFKYNFWATNTQGYPHVSFYTHNPSDPLKTAEITMYSGGSPLDGQVTGWNEVVVTPTSPAASGSSGFFWYGDETAPGTIDEGLPNTYTLGQFQTTAPFSTHVIDRIQVEFGWWSAGTTGVSYVDKLQLNAATSFDYNLEPIAIDKAVYKAGDTVTITVQNANTSGVVAVLAKSTIAPAITIAATETGTGTGVFTGTFQIVNSTPGTGQLLAAHGNTITVDYTGNWGIDGSSPTVTTTATYDTVAPTVALTSSATNPTNASPMVVTATFSEAVTGFALSDIVVTNGTANTLDGGPTSYTFNVVPTVQGLVTVNIPAGVGVDAAGNPNTAATALTRTYDATPPTVLLSAAATNPTNASPIAVTATFSEVVVGGTNSFELGDITVTNGTAGNFVDLGGSHTTFTFDVTPAADGLVTVAIAGSVCTDLAGNLNTAATSLTRTSDRTVPTVVVTSTTFPTGGTTDVAPVPFTATFSEAVTGFDLSDISVTPTTATASNLVAVSSTVYNFTVTPTVAGAVTVSIPAAKAKDAANNDNTISTPNPFSFTFVVVNPTVTLTTTASSPTKTSPIAVTATFSATVTGFDATDITVTNGTASNFVALTGAIYTFDVTPAAEGDVVVKVLAGVCQDALSRPNILSNTLTTEYDSVAPTVVMTASGGAPWTVTATWSELLASDTFIQSDLTLTNSLVSDWTVTTTDKVFTFVVTPIAAGTVTVDIAAGKCTDVAGNLNAAVATPFTRVYSIAANAIYLGTGWNLISLPLVPADTAIGTVLSGISTNVQAVWYYDTSVSPAAWKSWAPGLPSPSLTTMTDGKAYWLDMTAPSTLIPTGTAFPAPPALPSAYNVAVGWNMIGFRSTAIDTDASVYLGTTVWGNTVRMYSYNNVTGYALVAATTHLVPGQGYWLAVTTAGTIYP